MLPHIDHDDRADAGMRGETDLDLVGVLAEELVVDAGVVFVSALSQVEGDGVETWGVEDARVVRGEGEVERGLADLEQLRPALAGPVEEQIRCVVGEAPIAVFAVKGGERWHCPVRPKHTGHGRLLSGGGGCAVGEMERDEVR